VGAKILKSNLLAPLTDPITINARLDFVVRKEEREEEEGPKTIRPPYNHRHSPLLPTHPPN
jgi:hypothetical protein